VTTPFNQYLARLHADLKGLSGGAVADYIPELAKARPDAFAIAFATIDGEVYAYGDTEEAFTIQSVSKPFAYGLALERLGQETMLSKVGVEPTGEAFNALGLDEDKNRPFNPMVNSGAIAVAALTEGAGSTARVDTMRRDFSRFAGRSLEIDAATHASESETGHRNRALAYLMLNTGMIAGDPEEVLAVYFSQCSLNVTCADLAIMGAVLANNGVHPRSGERILSPACVRDVITLMSTCGMYDYAGEWSYDVGLPAKSGVSGSILAILPGQLSIAVWSPPIDRIGNSVRGVAACKQISADFGLHLFMNAVTVEDVIRRESRGGKRVSMRIRNPSERARLDREGHRIAVIEIQGGLYFASAERLVRRIGEIVPEADYMILDCTRLSSMDAAALRFIEEALAAATQHCEEVAISGVSGPEDHAAKGALNDLAARLGVLHAESTDAALERFEDRLLESLMPDYDATRFALTQIDMFEGLTGAQLRIIEDILRPMQFDADQQILSRGSDGRMLFIVARGSVSVRVPDGKGDTIRIGCIGPGQFFGEMALLSDAPRSADVFADERVICYGLTRDDLDALGRIAPEALATILLNMSREFTQRIRQNNALLRERL